MCVMGNVGWLNRCGMEACRQGRLDEAEKNLLSALKQVQTKESGCIEAKIRNNLGIVYELRGDRVKARYHYVSALSLLIDKSVLSHPLFARISAGLERVS